MRHASSEGSLFAPGGAPKADREHRRLYRWTLLALCTLLVGIVASAFGDGIWQSYVRTQQTQASKTAAAATSETLTSALQRDADFTGTATTLLTTTPGLTNRALASWFDILNARARYPGAFGLTYLEVVPQDRLAQFASVTKSDPPFGLPLPGRFSITPPGTRARYCLTRFGFAELPAHLASSVLVHVAEFLHPDFDYCEQQVNSLLSVAASTGQPMVASLATLFTEPTVGAPHAKAPPFLARSGLMAVFSPVYVGGLVPRTQAIRERQLQGWVLSLFDASDIVAPVLQSDHHATVALEYRNPTGKIALVDATGAIPAGSTSRTFRLQGSRWIATVTTRAVDAGVPPSEQGLAVLAVGLLVSMLLFLLIQTLSRSRSRALDLVEERTSELEHQALHDALTGLPNRSLIFDRAKQMLARAERDQLPVAVLVVDLDGFKFVNDSLGHDIGDELLRAVARRFEVTTRASDSVGRVGGDEFVVLAEGSSVEAGADLIAERLLGVLNEPYHLTGGHNVSVGASIGVATGLRTNAEQLLRDADVALYEAKSRGQNQYVIFDPDVHAALSDRIELETELRTAVALEQFRVLYQPILKLDDGSVLKVEALVRWRHPSRGMISPVAFIPALEESGLITAVGRLVLEESCRQASAWHEFGYPALGVSVNVSARQLESNAFVSTVQEALDRSGLEPGLLTLEITESTIMRDTDATVSRLAQLKQLGVRLAVDDFGTGYSSLAYLQRFPVDELKIDRSFVSGTPDSPDQDALIRTLVQLGRVLGLETVAEGIETRAQLGRLRDAGCDFGQGYLFARPLDPLAIERFLEERVPVRSR
ncbi:MAG: putative bifunctional diguanylate cyclase/phosphodiesterase [Acidimicrobiales bacterium]